VKGQKDSFRVHLYSIWRKGKKGVNFTNILRAVFFVRKDCAKLFCTYILSLNFEFWHNCAHKVLVKLTKGRKNRYFAGKTKRMKQKAKDTQEVTKNFCKIGLNEIFFEKVFFLSLLLSLLNTFGPIFGPFCPAPLFQCEGCGNPIRRANQSSVWRTLINTML
jgi:hypothetical protein